MNFQNKFANLPNNSYLWGMKERERYMAHFVNPFTDIGFKIIFGQPASKELLITLLNELLASDNVNDRGIIFDLYCLTSSGEYIIVEMQNRWHSNFLDRTLYYVCRAISRLIERPVADEVDLPVNGNDGVTGVKEAQPRYGDRYRLSTVYGIFLMNFKEAKLEPKFRTDAVVADRENGKVVNPHFRQIYLQFPYFTKQLEDCVTLYDKLIYALKNMNEWNRMPDALKEQVFKHLERLAAVANLSEANRVAYDKAVDRFYVSRIYEEDMQDRVENAMREGREKGMREGREEGMKEGREEGMKEGREEGMKEGKKEGQKEGKLEDAQNLKRLGVSLDIISQATGLSLGDIENL